MENFYNSVIFKRHSVRRFRQEEIAQEALWRILKGANAAPSAHNSQPWHFVVVRSPEAKLKLAELTGRAWVEKLLAKGNTLEIAHQKKEQSISFLSTVATVIVVFQRGEKPFDTTRPDNLEEVLGRQSVAAATAQLLLSATAEGIGSCWYCMPHHCPNVFEQIFQMGNHYRPEALITLGIPDDIGFVPRVKKEAWELSTFY